MSGSGVAADFHNQSMVSVISRVILAQEQGKWPKLGEKGVGQRWGPGPGTGEFAESKCPVLHVVTHVCEDVTLNSRLHRRHTAGLLYPCFPHPWIQPTTD